jgi:mannose-6-phosphate isomerase-like protein (cupin superfamily)
MTSRKVLFSALFAAGASVMLAQQPAPAAHPTCNRCPATYVPKTELDAYVQQAIQHGLMDQQVRNVDIGHMDLGIGIVYRPKSKPGKPEIAEHEQISEAFYIIEGGGTIQTGPDLEGLVPRPSTMKTVKQQNGPGFNAEKIDNPVTTVLKPGDVFIVPAGTGHSWIDIPDHVVYLMVRLDPDKILPLKSEEQSKVHLSKPYHEGQDNY